MASPRDNIPSPPGLPLIGNLLDLQNDVPILALEHLLDTFGPIIKLNILGNERIITGSAEIVEELCDEKRFWKSTSAALDKLSQGSKGEEDSHRGLFSAPSEDDPDWGQAHRTLVPAFGPLAIQSMFDEMHDIASQLVLKWARMGEDYRIPVTEDFTRLTLDTIALCAMDYRFNSFYADEMHPYVQAMNITLVAAGNGAKLSSMVRSMLPWDRSREEVHKAGEYMNKVSRELVQARRKHPTVKKDLLNAMVNGKDPKTGESMSDGLIAANMNTFLVAGHETTSGFLSFCFLNLLRNPETYFKAQQEVDQVVGRGKKLKAEHLKDLKYINAVLRETLRLRPTAPAFSRSIRPDNPNDIELLAGGQYAIRRGDKVLCLTLKSQRDPKIFGDDANEFRPDRMTDENFQKLPKGAYRAFGTGVRSCIGQSLAWQEALMAVALVLQNFDLRMDDTNYIPKIKQNLTIKPDGFYMHAALRGGITATSLQASLTSSDGAADTAVTEGIKRSETGLIEGLTPMTILYGSNTGTCLALAQKLSVVARRHGYRADVKEMDAGTNALPKGQPIVIITASYEGEPPDNAGQFVKWLEMLEGDSSLQGVEYAVFGCGNSDWANTFQRVPVLVDDLYEKRGAKRLTARGSANAAKDDIFSSFESWADGSLWPAISPSASGGLGDDHELELEMSSTIRGDFLRQDVQSGTVKDARFLTAPGEPEKRHLEVELPMSYQAGDYLAILPLNPQQSVLRVMKRFRLSLETTLTIAPGAATFLPTGVTLSVVDLLKGFVELSSPLTRKDLQACIASCEDAGDKAWLEQALDRAKFAEMTENHVSLLDLLEKHNSIKLSFSRFLSMLSPLRPRHYSISSSPLADPNTCSVTYAVIDEAARSGQGRYIGVASSYLASLKPGDDILVSVRSTNKFFHLPADPETTPIVMLGAGTGLAPFRSFVQERASQIAAGRQLAPALMFMGCRSASKDRLYGDELDAWVKAGAVDVRYAFSREPQHSEGCKYVHHRMLNDKEDVRRLWRANCKLFVCGGPKVAEGIAEASKQIVIESFQESGKTITEQKAEEWFREQRNERFVVDTFA